MSVKPPITLVLDIAYEEIDMDIERETPDDIGVSMEASSIGCIHHTQRKQRRNELVVAEADRHNVNGVREAAGGDEKSMAQQLGD